MIVLKKSYDKLFDLLSKERKDNTKLMKHIKRLEHDVYNYRERIRAIKELL